MWFLDACAWEKMYFLCMVVGLALLFWFTIELPSLFAKENKGLTKLMVIAWKSELKKHHDIVARWRNHD